MATCGNVVAEIDRVQEQAVSGIFRPDEPDLESRALEGRRPGIVSNACSMSTAFWHEGLDYVRDPFVANAAHLGLLLVLALGFWVVRWKSNQWATAGDSVSSANRVFQSPFAAALLLALAFLTIPLLPRTGINQGAFSDLGLCADHPIDPASRRSMGAAGTLFAQCFLRPRHGADSLCRRNPDRPSSLFV